MYYVSFSCKVYAYSFSNLFSQKDRNSTYIKCAWRTYFKQGCGNRDIFGRLRLRLRLRGSIPAPAPAPGKMYRLRRLRLRLRCSSPHVSLTSPAIRFSKNDKYQNMTSYWLQTWPWVWMLLWMSAFEICHPLSSKVSGWHWRGHKLLGVALSEISGLLLSS